MSFTLTDKDKKASLSLNPVKIPTFLCDDISGFLLEFRTLTNAEHFPLKTSEDCIKCKFQPTRPRTVTSAVVLIYEGPFLLEAEMEQVV